MMTPQSPDKPSVLMRVARTIAYACIGTSGLLLIMSPIFATTETPLAITMTWFMMVGGYISAVGAATNRWAGEFMGIPLLMASFSVFGFITFRENRPDAPYIAAANLSLLNGLALLFLARWLYVFSVQDAAQRFSRKKRPNE